jgi:gamma-glutamylcyclotransferase
MASDVMGAWCAGARALGPASLPGFRLLFLRKSVRWKAGAADVVPEEGATTWGVLYEVTTADLEALDEKEYLAQGGYQRRDVEVEVDGSRLQAVTYEVVEKAPHELAPKQEYVDTLIRGAEEHGLPTEWIDVLKELPRRFATDD